MEKTGFLPLILLTVLPSTAMFAQKTSREIRGEVKYISARTVYIDIGEAVGLSKGDTVVVRRDDSTIDLLVITAVAAHSSSCSPIGPIQNIRIGDSVTSTIESSPEPEKAEEMEPKQDIYSTRRTKPNRLDGRISLGSLMSEDLTGSGLSFSEPTVNTKIRLRNLAGEPLSISFRQKIRHIGREQALTADPDEDRWINRVFELTLSYEPEEIPVRLSLGRFLPPRARGLGYIDGGLVELQLNSRISIGAAGGLRPDYYDAGLQRDEKTFGFYTTYKKNQVQGRAFLLSAGYLGSYSGGTVNREFFYLEGNYRRGRKLSTYNSMEIDLNRGWKRSGGESLFEMSGIYLSARYQLRDYLSITSSFDNRKNIRNLSNRSVPDSLFDDAVRRGFRTGVSWSLSERIHATGNVGVRFREGVDNTLSASGGLRVRGFLLDRLILNAHLSIFRTMLARGYRPYIGLHFPPFHLITLTMSAGSYIYDSRGQSSNYPWIGSTVRYGLNSRTYLSSSLWTYLSGNLKSARLFSEIEYLF